MHRLQELVRLHRLGETCHRAAKLLRMGPNVERKYRVALQAAGLLDGRADELPSPEELKAAVEKYCPGKSAPQQVSSVKPWLENIAEMQR